MGLLTLSVYCPFCPGDGEPTPAAGISQSFPASTSLSCLRETPYLNSPLYIQLHLLVQPKQINVNAMQTKCTALSGSDPRRALLIGKVFFSSFVGIPIQHSRTRGLRRKSNLLMRFWLRCLVVWKIAKPELCNSYAVLTSDLVQLRLFFHKLSVLSWKIFTFPASGLYLQHRPLYPFTP